MRRSGILLFDILLVNAIYRQDERGNEVRHINPALPHNANPENKRDFSGIPALENVPSLEFLRKSPFFSGV